MFQQFGGQICCVLNRIVKKTRNNHITVNNLYLIHKNQGYTSYMLEISGWFSFYQFFSHLRSMSKLGKTIGQLNIQLIGRGEARLYSSLKRVLIFHDVIP